MASLRGRRHLSCIGPGKGHVFIRQKHKRRRLTFSTRRAVLAVLHFVDGSGISDIRIRGCDPQSGALPDPDGVRGLYDERRARDACVVAGGGIIRPRVGAVLVLPLAHGHVLQVRRQGDLRGRHRPGGVVLEHLLTADPCAFRVLAGGQQREGDIRRSVNGQSGIRIRIGHISDVGQLFAGGGRQVVFTDRQYLAADRFAGTERSLSGGTILAFPVDGERGVVQRNGGLIGVDHRRDHQLASSSRPVRAVRADIHVMDLRAGLIGPQIYRKRLAVRQVDDGF